jgi:aspartate/methionine/tyrosine aminotransferase
MVSAASCVEDVNKDPVVVFDGFTKNWRYPGWRVAWALGPQKIAEALASAGSFLDGGGSNPLQRAAIGLVSTGHVMDETHAIQECFRAKRNLMVPRLENLGVKIDRVPEGTFYVWGSVADLAPPFQDGMSFFREALKHKVIVVPGEFFDVNPGKRRRGSHGRFKGYVRFSFGPNLKTVATALDRLERMVKSNKT